MDYKKLNNVLKNLDNLKKVATFVEKVAIKEGKEGEEGEYWSIWKLNEDLEGTFLRVRYFTDSYGDNETLKGVEFVEQVEKKVLQWEEI